MRTWPLLTLSAVVLSGLVAAMILPSSPGSFAASARSATEANRPSGAPVPATIVTPADASVLPEPLLTPVPAQAQPTTFAELRAQTREMQTELARVGCFGGAADGLWGTSSEAALSRFYTYARMPLTDTAPTAAAIARVKRMPGRVCPAVCEVGTQLVDGTCVAIPPSPTKAERKAVAKPERVERLQPPVPAIKTEPARKTAAVCSSARGKGGSCTGWMFHNTSCRDACGRHCTQTPQGRTCS